jgi:hypothetical protein
LKAENDPAFRERLEQAVSQAAPEEMAVPAQEYDAPLSLAQADEALVQAIAQLEPFGLGNPSPVFFTEGVRLVRRHTCGAQGAHLQLTFGQGQALLSGIAFGMGAQSAALPETVDAAYTLSLNAYQGRITVQCQVQALRPCASALADSLAAELQSAFDAALLGALTDELAAFPEPLAGNGLPRAEVIGATPECLFSANGEAATADRLLSGRQGTLLVAYTRETALATLAAFGDRVDCIRGAPEDPRCFHTLLYQPEPSAVRGRWKAVALLDGSLTPGGLAYWQHLLPDAAVYAARPTAALANCAQALDAGDERYRVLYRLLRASAFATLSQTAREAGLTEAQTLAGLQAFQSLEFIDFSPSPFRYTFHEPRKRTLSDSPVLSALRALSAAALCTP